MIFVIGICIAFFLSFLLISKKNKTIADKILLVWLIITGIHIGLYYIYTIPIQKDLAHLIGAALPFPLLHGPLLYLYTMALTQPPYFKKYHWLWHFTPAFGMYLWLIPFFSLSASQKLMTLQNDGTEYETFGLISLGLMIASGFGYIIGSSLLLKNHKRKIIEQFSNIERINLQWLQYLIIALGIIWLFVAFGNDDLIFSAATLFVLFIGYFGINQVGIFTNINNLIPPQYSANVDNENVIQSSAFVTKVPDNEGLIKKKYQKSGLSGEQGDQVQKRLAFIMMTEKLYKNPELTLADLANRLEIHTNYLSQVINEKEGVNFYDYINGLRIEEFKRQIALPENKQYTLLTVAYDCGFNSKSSFNRYFKKMMEVQPSEYIKNLN